MDCLDDRAVQAWVGGALPEDDRDVVRTHLDSCDSCRDLVASVVEAQWVGQTAGRYRLLDLVGGGAMGEVYRAQDPDLGRDIAIKLVRPGGSEQQLLREAQAMARLTHPNVIRVYDVGTVGDRVFLAMELVTGRTLRAWLAEATRSWREIVGVMRQAGSGLVAAHEAGLVHGDFKPDNVLVAADERVLVTDFGLARLQATEGPVPVAIDGPLDRTRTRGLVGTPAYMAPEQLADSPAATAASDQFSFAVAAYEALYGARPFPAVDLATLRASLADAKVAFPSGRRVPGRVVRALRRGLAARPADRFPSLKAMLAELDAAMSRRALAIGAGVVSVAAAVGVTLFATADRGPACDDGASQLDGVWDASRRATLERAFAATDVPYATTSLASAAGLLDRYRDAWVAAYADTCEATHVRKEQSDTLFDLRMRCLQRRKGALDAVVDTLAGGGREIVRDAVAAVTALPPVADCEDVASLQDLETLPAEAAARAEIAAIETELARCRAVFGAGQYQAGRTCATAVAERATRTGYRPLIADTQWSVGVYASRLRDWPEADAALTRAHLAAEESRDARTRARALIGLVGVAGERALFEPGHERIAHAAAVIKALEGDKALAGDLALAAGVLYLREGKLDKASEELARAVALREETYGKDDARVAEPLVPLAVVQATRKKDDEAKQLLDRALAIQRAALGEAHPALGKTLHALAQIQARVGKTDEALASQRRAYEILLAAYGENHQDVAMSVGVAAQVHLIAGKYAEAAPFAKRSAELTERAAGADHPDTATALTILAAVLSRTGDSDGALDAHRRALAIRIAALGPDHIHTTQSQVNYAMALRLKARCSDALPLLEAARAVRVKKLGAEHPEVIRVLQSIADCQTDLGDHDAAIASFEAVMRVQAAAPARTADDKVSRAMAAYGLARALWAKPESHARATELARTAYAELTALKDRRADAIATWAKSRGVTLATPTNH